MFLLRQPQPITERGIEACYSTIDSIVEMEFYLYDLFY